MTLIRERINRIDQNDQPPWAYNIALVGSRFLSLSETLSPSELLRLAEADELYGLVALLAEVAGFDVYPFDQAIRQDDLGSVTRVMSDEGDYIEVFRSTTDMLRARVLSRPDDFRAKEVLNVYEQYVIPLLKGLRTNESLILISPPDQNGEVEYDYGFLYVYSIDQHGQINAKAIKLPNGTKYAEISLNGARYNRGSSNSLLQSVYLMDRPPSHAVMHLLGPNVNLLGNYSVNDYSNWIDAKMNEYIDFMHWVQTLEWTNRFLTCLATGHKSEAQYFLAKLQTETIFRYRPDIYNRLQLGTTFGSIQILLPCGYVELQGFGGSEFMARLGMGIDVGGFDCPHCGKFIKYGSGDTCPHCRISKYEYARLKGTNVC